MQPEVTVLTPFGQCDRPIEMTIRWNEQADWVKVRLRGEEVLERFPDLVRTEGVNFFPNPFWPESKDIQDGRYQFWFISPAGNMTFFYDPVTFDLIGSEFDFTTPPAGAIPLSIPSVKVLGSDFFQPDEDGDLDVTFTWQYSSMVRLDRPDLAHHRTSFPPTNLCGAHPFRYDLTSARGYMGNALPVSEALEFSDYLRNGMFFNITVEPATYFVDPPLDTQTSTHSNASLFGGGIPKDYTWDIDAFFMNVAPGIRPFGGAGSCDVFFNGTHILDVNYCE